MRLYNADIHYQVAREICYLAEDNDGHYQVGKRFQLALDSENHHYRGEDCQHEGNRIFYEAGIIQMVLKILQLIIIFCSHCDRYLYYIKISKYFKY